MTQPVFVATTADDLYMELAERFRCKLPRREYSRAKTAIQARFLHAIGLTWGEYDKLVGEKRGEYFSLNPDSDLREWAGNCLEMLWLSGWER